MRPTIMEFFTSDGEKISQQRLQKEYTLVRQKSGKARQAAIAKHSKNKDSGHADASPKQCERSAPIPILTKSSTAARESLDVAREPAAAQGKDHSVADDDLETFRLAADVNLRILSILGHASTGNPHLVKEWLDDDIQPGTIIKAIERVMANRNSAPSSLRYFDKPVRELQEREHPPGEWTEEEAIAAERREWVKAYARGVIDWETRRGKLPTEDEQRQHTGGYVRGDVWHGRNAQPEWTRKPKPKSKSNGKDAGGMPDLPPALDRRKGAKP